MFAKHLPPSREVPRVLALDAEAAEALAGRAEVAAGQAGAPDGAQPGGPFDAVAGSAGPERVTALSRLLRPGGRLILKGPGKPEALLRALEAAGLIHCLVEAGDGIHLYRGERPPEAGAPERLQGLAQLSLADFQRPAGEVRAPYLFLLIAQTPNKPAWKLGPDDRIEWRAATVQDTATGQTHLLAFTSLVKAVAFMQPAVRAGAIGGVNKVGKFPASAADEWGLPLLVNAPFKALRGARLGPPLLVDAAQAVTGDE